MTSLSEPGLWILIAIVATALHGLLGAVLARPYYRQLNQIAFAVMDSKRSTEADKKWLKTALSIATNRPRIWSLAVVGPFLGLATLPSAYRVVVASHRSGIEKALAEESAKTKVSEVDEYPSAFWSSDFRRSGDYNSILAALLSAPILAAWLSIWFVPSALVLLFGGATKSVAGIFRLAIESALSARHRTHASL